jgi:uncharacterized protein
MSNNKITLDRVTQTINGRQEGFINVGRKADGSWVSIPVIIVEGKEKGPLFLVDACIHGDEYEGTEAIIRIARTLNSAELKGTFVGVPALNMDAFIVNSRNSPIDNTNMNRIFPGNPDTYITHRIVNTFVEKIQKKADYIISFHGGGMVLHLEPLVGYNPQDDEVGRLTKKMAQAFGTKVIWRMQNLPFVGIASSEAKKCGIPAILPEIGSQCSRLYDRQKNIDMCASGILNVMKYVGVLPGEVKQVPDQLDIELQYFHTSDGGIHKLMKNVMERAKKGEVLASVTDVFGNVVSEVKAPFDGIVIGFWSVPVIQPGDWSYLFAKILN